MSNDHSGIDLDSLLENKAFLERLFERLLPMIEAREQASAEHDAVKLREFSGQMRALRQLDPDRSQ